MVRPLVAAAILLLAPPAEVGAVERVLTLSPKETRIAFTLDATAHTVHGTVPVTAGTIRFEPVTGRASGEVTIDLTRARTGNDRRDRDMHRTVLETGKYPKAVLQPERLAGRLPPSGPAEVKLQGVLRFHGTDHRLEIPARVVIDGSRLRGEAHLTIPYVAWGLKDPSRFVLRVGKSVDVRVEIVGELK